MRYSPQGLPDCNDPTVYRAGLYNTIKRLLSGYAAPRVTGAGIQTMTKSQVNALIASAYNLHAAGREQGDAMTPAKAAKLPRGDRAMLCKILRDKGGSDLYTQEQAGEALALIVNREA